MEADFGTPNHLTISSNNSLEAGNPCIYVYWQVTLVNDCIQQKY